MDRSILRRIAVVTSMALLFLMGASFTGALAAEGNPPSVECGEGVPFNKFDFQDADITIGDEVPLTDSNTDPEQIITLTKVADGEYEYEVDPESDLEIFKIVVKGGSDSEDVTEIDGSITVPSNVSHVTFCLRTAASDDDDTADDDDTGDDDTGDDDTGDDDTTPSVPETPETPEVDEEVGSVVKGTVVRKAAGLAKTGPGLAGVASAGAGFLGTGLGLSGLAGARRRRDDIDTMSPDTLNALLKIYDARVPR